MVYIGIQSEETVGIVEGSEKFTFYLVDTRHVEFQIIPRLRVSNHIPTQWVRSISGYRRKRIYCIPEPFGHFITLGI